MSEKAFIKKLKGKDSAKSLVEVQNDVLVNVASGLPNTTATEQNIIDSKNSSVIVGKNSQNWVLSGDSLLLSTNDAYTSEFVKSGTGLWLDAEYIFPASINPENPVVSIINPSAKWILRFCGKNLLSANENINFTLVVKIGTTHISNINLSVNRQAGFFCKDLTIDFSESLTDIIKVEGGEKLTLQLICGDSTANANIYNGKTILTLLQRKIDGESVGSDTMTFDDIEATLPLKEDVANKGVANGYCPLDADVKIPLANMPISALKYIGTWDATTNTPSLSDSDITKAGNVYIVNAAGTQFSIDWNISDWLVYNDTGVIQKIDNTDLVTSVNSKTGAVVLDKTDVGLGNVDNIIPTYTTQTY